MDADVLGLARVVARIRPDVTFPGDPGGEVRKRIRAACPITDTATKDLIWIPTVTQQGWAIITRDRGIGRKPAERNAVTRHGAKLFVLVKPLNRSFDLWSQLEVFLTQWRRIERFSQEPGPFIYNVHRTTMRRVWPPA